MEHAVTSNSAGISIAPCNFSTLPDTVEYSNRFRWNISDRGRGTHSRVSFRVIHSLALLW